MFECGRARTWRGERRDSDWRRQCGRRRRGAGRSLQSAADAPKGEEPLDDVVEVVAGDVLGKRGGGGEVVAARGWVGRQRSGLRRTARAGRRGRSAGGRR